MASAGTAEQDGNKHFQKNGYAEFSEWMATSDDFTLFRRFDALNIRIILRLQDRIMRTEEKLAKLDAASRNPDVKSSSGRHEERRKEKDLTTLDDATQDLDEIKIKSKHGQHSPYGPHEERNKVLEKLTGLLKEYSSLPKTTQNKDIALMKY